ncbi:ComF family protein [Psychrobacter sp. JB385]|uniref:ComF family protein n=1 Tax=Psychrobacter sp. JB385 TaxID=1434841 RepID=UPI00097F4D1E|nr:ComF family protein [Psychrobacter sp. JB385]SJN44102.1 Competence protein F homolog, phosphoribosyltransferase domain; protein YhgH required for utilization of DNA as sole source of carbon and energy [Psychrobacter sp. JB385]
MMRYLAPYQTGLWLAEYFDIRCQLCRTYRSVPQAQLAHANSSQDVESRGDAATQFLPSRPSLIAKYRQRFNNGLLCKHCHHSITWLPKPFTVDIAAGTILPIQAATYYDYPIRQAIRAFKYHENMTKLPLLLHILRQLPRPHGCHKNNSVIVAMPTTEQRLIKRGFDPVLVLATQLSKHWQIPLWQGVARIDNTVSQQGLTRAERLSNLDNAFALIEKPPVKRLLLFDDVATTGASLQALGQAICSQTMPLTSDESHTTDYYHIRAYALAHGSQS